MTRVVSVLLFALLGLAFFMSGSAASLRDNKNVELVPASSDVGKNMTEIVQARGYDIYQFDVITEDGYILTMFNIPYGKASAKSPRGQRGPPVLLQHGLLDSSFTFVSNFEDESLAYILADQGFDVWFGNNRGNTYGRRHVTKNPDDGTNDFWSFTWDEMASYDVPTFINFVVDQTGYSSIGWVGHSEGTIQIFAAASSTTQSVAVKDAIAKLNLFVALAPVAYVTNLASKEIRILANLGVPQDLLKHGLYEFLPHTSKISVAAPSICRVIENVCDEFLMTVAGPSQNLNESRIQVYVSETPAGTSTQNLDHWCQVS